MSEHKEAILYVETTSDDAVDLIENLVKVEMAKKILDTSSLAHDQVGGTLQNLRELERDLRFKIRNTVLQPDPVRVSKHLAARIRDQIRKEAPGF